MQAQKDRKLYQGILPRLNFPLQLIFFAGIYLLSSYLAINLFRLSGENISYFWPGAGLTLSALFLHPKKRWPAIMAVQLSANFLVNIINQAGVGPSLGFSLIDGLAIYLCAASFESQLQRFYELKFLTVIRNFFFQTLIVAGLASVPAAIMIHAFFGDDLLNAGTRYFMAMLISWWVLTPFLVQFFTAHQVEDEDIPIWRNDSRLDRLAETAFYSSLIIGSATYLFLFATPTADSQPLLRSYILFPLFFPIVARFRLYSLGLLLLIVSVLSLIGTSLGLGEFSAPGNLSSANLGNAQYFIMALTFSTYIFRISVRRIRYTRVRLARTEKEVRSTFDKATVGILHTDPQGNLLRVNRAIYQMLGYPENSTETLITADNFHTIFFDEKNYSLYQQNFTAPTRWANPLLELRSLNGEKVHVFLTAHPEEDESGQLYDQVFVNNVTERVKNVALVRASELRLRIATDATLTGLWEYDMITHKLSANKAMASLIGISPEEFPPTYHEVITLVHPEDLEDLNAGAEGIARGMTEFIDVETRLHFNPQGWRWLHVKGTVFERNPAGVPTKMLGTAVDITNLKMTKQALRKANSKLEKQLEEIKTMQKRLEQQAVRDPLTNLYNRRFLDDALKREVYRADHESSAFGLLLLEIDHFHEIVDTLGKQKSNQLIALVAELLQSSFTGSDYTSRLDADNFGVVLAGGDPKAYHTRVANVIDQINGEASQRMRLTITISGGLAVYPRQGSSAEEVFTAAENALHLAKRSGRNRVALAD